VTITRFIWTDHAELRLAQRGLTTHEVEEAIRDLHQDRQANKGDADWRVEGTRADGRRFAVIYDCPASGSDNAARVVSVWILRGARHF